MAGNQGAAPPPSALPPFPALKLHIVDDVTARSRCDEGFVRVRRRRLKLAYPDGSESRDFAYDEAWREALDAVVIAAHYRDAEGVRHVFLRSALRPPAALRPTDVWPVAERPTLGNLWELPAGLVEQGERSVEGLRAAAARELGEEIGFFVDPTSLAPLGASVFPSPGLCGERLFFFAVEVAPGSRGAPTEDGSPLEKAAVIVDLTLEQALAAVRAGELEDMKTELGLRRLAELP